MRLVPDRRVLMWLVVAACMRAACAFAQEAPEVSFDSLRTALRGRPVARVHGAWGVAEVARPRVEGLVLHYERVLLPAVGATLPAPLALAQVERVERSVGRSLCGALVGAAAGFAVSVAWNAASGSGGDDGGPREFPDRGSLFVAPVGIAIGASLGGLLGTRWTGWQTVYVRE